MKRVTTKILCLVGLAGLLSCAPGQPPDPRPPVAPVGAVTTLTAPRILPGAVATALDEARGVPRFLRATSRQAAPAGATHEAAARAHLARHAPAYRLAGGAPAHAEVAAVHDTGRGGVIVTFRQRAHGIEIYRGEVKVLMRRDHELVAIAGSLHAPPGAAPVFARSPADALAGALGAHYAADIPAAALIDHGPIAGGYVLVDLAGPMPVGTGRLRLGEPARVKPVLFPQGEALQAAYFVEFFAGTGARAYADAFRYVVGADDGRVLEQRDLTAHGWQFRLWADADGRPLAGPQADFTPHPTGVPDGSRPDYIPPTLVAIDAFNHNPDGVADPWLPEGATESRGNNVDAYVDHTDPDGFSSGDFRATTTAADTFDRTYDTSVAPLASDEQARAGLIQAFYTINWMHDWFYDSGFDEAAGNAQGDNYGRGGLGNDRLLFEGQDFSGSDNSDMTTPADGRSPRMQAYTWSAARSQSLEVTPPGVSLQTGGADFGPRTFDVTGTVVLVDDGTDPVTNGCEAIVSDVSGKIALLDRGVCPFEQKALNAQSAGAIAVIIANNQGGPPFDMSGSGLGTVTIPVLMITQADGDAIKAALAQGAVTAHLTCVGGVDRDGALDSTVVMHEWGHYLHGRLTDCAQYQCFGMGEGWGDFLGLLAILNEGDDLDGTYALAIYASTAMGDAGYFGIRRAPYSVDMTKNPFTFRHIMDAEPLPEGAPLNDNGAPNSEVHNAGEIWAQMLFEAYVALLKETQTAGATRTFAEVRRAMTDYVVAGLKLTPPDATYTEARDALLAAAAAQSPDDVAVMTEAFARRGAGSCAVAAGRDSYSFEGVVESYTVGPQIVVGTPKLDDSAASCDEDGVLDAGERGLVTVEVVNASPLPTAAVTVSFTSPTAGLAFPSGDTFEVGALAPFATATATLEVELDRTVSAMQLVRVGTTIAAPDACKPEIKLNSAFRVNYVEQPAASATDDVESPEPLWTPEGEYAADAWARVEAAPGNHVWRGVDLSWLTDTWLTSPPLAVSATESFVLSFRHRYDFEASDYDGELVFWDGAVIEITKDDGLTWEDIATYVDPGYGGALTDISENPLGLRSAFVARNAAYPARERVSLDLGTALAGETIRVRFRIGTDQAAGMITGWELDDIGFQGTTNTPFAALVETPSACPAAAGPDGGVGAGGGGSDGGCGCVVPGASRGTAWTIVVLLPIVLRRLRRARSSHAPSHRL